ncbi:hypothetical protein QFC19_001317 [Naganishia cerealis]|uniref:Uncharacterized protein n=1 Tax=Naganishia cerealis TaxID=610337 RepID=A0ACC2WI22_9TREE|nr:hypothetical protein QFC19_001317 [Naganishia cerealis]
MFASPLFRNHGSPNDDIDPDPPPPPDPKMAAFRALKPICVPLMALPRLTPGPSSSRALDLLQRLRTTLRNVDHPEEAFTPSLLGPAAQDSGMPDRVLECLLDCLTFVVDRWTRMPQGIDIKLWDQLWTFAALVLGGPMARGPEESPPPSPSRSEETLIAGMNLLEALLKGPSSPPAVVTRALVTLDGTITTWFSAPDRARVLASVMPGLISALVKLVVGAPSSHQEPTTGTRAWQSGWNEWADTTAASVLVLEHPSEEDEEATEPVLPHYATGLEDLMRRVSEVDIAVVDEDAEATVIGSPSDEGQGGQEEKMRELLLGTLLRLAYPPAEPLPSVFLPARRAVRDLLGLTLSPLPQPSGASSIRQQQHAARTQELRQSVQTIAEHELAAFPARVKGSSERPLRAGVDIICALAFLANGEQEEDDEDDMKGDMGGDYMDNDDDDDDDDDDVRGNMRAGAAPLRKCFARILGPQGGIERWSWPLLVALELDRPVDLDIYSQDSRGMERAWDLARIDGGLPASLAIEDQASGMGSDAAGGQGSVVSFPAIRLRHVESREMNDRIAGMFEAIGRAAGVAALTTVEHLMGVSQRIRRRRAEVAIASSALWLAGRVVDGLAAGYETTSTDEARRLRKAARKIIDLVVQFDEEEEDFTDDDPVTASGEDPSDSTTETTVVERRKGLGTISKLLDDSKRTPTRATEQAQSLHAAMHRQLVVCLNLRLLATCAKILSTSFRRHLIATLYLVLSHLGSPYALVRRHAEITLGHIAYHAGYASPRNLILDNVDYVINIVSQRMTYKRLDPLAPMVLISMINLVGEPIVPLVQDIIADIFDALDDFHGYTLLSSTVLAVMDTLMKTMANEVQYAEYKPQRSTSSRMRRGPDPGVDFGEFTAWYSARASKARQTVDEMLDKAPNEPWGKASKDAAAAAPDNASAEQETPPPTRAQEVCIQMMQKSIYFLTHANPFLTARVLSLFASGVPVLVTQERETDALPLIHQAWPYVLNRLKDPLSPPYVRTEAAALVRCLAQWTGDFMSRRILDDAWPIFRDLLARQKRHDDQSALARRSGGGGGGGARGTMSSYTVSHRLYLSMIQAMTYIIQSVPIADDLFWEMALAFRPFLDARVHDELGRGAVTLYRCMAARDADAVWLVLYSTMGAAGVDLPAYLRAPGLDIRGRVALVVSL